MMQPRYRPCGAARASTISNCGPPQRGGRMWMGQTGSCRSCSCCKSSPSLVEPTRLGVAISPGRRRPLRAGVMAGTERRGDDSTGKQCPTDGHSLKGGRDGRDCTSMRNSDPDCSRSASPAMHQLPPSRLWVLHPSHGGWDAMQDVSTSELHREIDAWPAAAGPVASDWLSQRPGQAGRSKQAPDNTRQRASQGREEKPTTSRPQQSSGPLSSRRQHQRASSAQAENRRAESGLMRRALTVNRRP